MKNKQKEGNNKDKRRMHGNFFKREKIKNHYIQKTFMKISLEIDKTLAN